VRIDPSAGNPMHVEVLAYLEYWRTMGYRDAGVQLRSKALRRFVAWADAQGVGAVAAVTPTLLERYRLALFHWQKEDGAPLSLNTQQLLLVPVRGFFRWLARTRRLSENPAAELELPRKPLRLPGRVLSVAEVQQVIDEAHVSAPWGIRDRAILEVLYTTGMRRSELACLQTQDWNREGASIFIRQGKGGRDRVVPLGPDLTDLLYQGRCYSTAPSPAARA
jgi:integrase/recombinase XerD